MNFFLGRKLHVHKPMKYGYASGTVNQHAKPSYIATSMW